MFGVEHDMLAREILEVNTFELIEDQTIDIDSIEEYQIPAHVPITALEEKLIDLINENRKAIKHLNKEIQSIKNKE